jgi:hypothetical protein
MMSGASRPFSSSASDLAELDGRRDRIVASPRAQILDSDEALTGLRELENSIVAVHLVTAVWVSRSSLMAEHTGRREKSPMSNLEADFTTIIIGRSGPTV